ncbi:hypothetical protein HZA86_01955 [Candidatus Uhrbacteria bacterium]|nr:hypothetical protein [Candidatus Uhrbacteria bacterium]
MRLATHHSLLLVIGLTVFIIGVLIFFNLFTIWWVLALAGVIVVSLLLGDHLWALALLIPLSVPIGRIGTIIVGQSYRYEITATEAALLVLGAILLYAIAWGTIAWHRVPMMERLWYALLVLAYGSLLWIVDGAKYLVGVRLLTYQFLSFLIPFTVVRSMRGRWASLWAIVISGMVMAAQLLWTLFQYPSIQKYFAQRSLVETSVGPMAFVVAIIVLLLPFAVIIGFHNHGVLRWIAWTFASIGGIAIIASVGRAALVAGFASSTFLYWQIGKGWTFLKRSAIIGIVLLVLASGGSFLPSLIIERFTSIVNSSGSAQFRIEEARTGLTVFRRHVLLGAGAGNLKYYYQRLFNGYSGESNNIIVQMAGEYGLVGLALLLGWVVAIRRALRAVRRYSHGRESHLMLVGFSSSLAAAAIHGMFEVTFFGLMYGVLFWYLMGMMAAWGQEADCVK